MSEFLQTALDSWNADPDAMVFWGTVIAFALFMGLVGYAIGRERGRGGDGFVLGVLLGPLGCLLILCLERRGRKCPECLGVVPDAARKCKHCGSEIFNPENPFKSLRHS